MRGPSPVPAPAPARGGVAGVAGEGAARGSGGRACRACLRRSWLLATLSPRLELRGRDPDALLASLGLDDERLLEALAGKRIDELRDAHRRFQPGLLERALGSDTVCGHHADFPARLRELEAPPALLHVHGIDRMREMLAAPVVAIVGTRRASDYGREVARGLARGLAGAGITVTAPLGEGIALAAHAGAAQIGRGTVVVMGGGLDRCQPAAARALYEAVRARGCALSELPAGVHARTWCEVARARLTAALASLVVVVEAGESPRELMAARLASELGRPVAAVPGRVTSPCSRGTHALLMRGAHLVRDARDVLELLGGAPTGAPGEPLTPPAPALTPRLRAVLDRVAAGEDTIAKLTTAQGRAAHGRDAQGRDAASTIVALAELELAGLVVRGDGGRYVACVR